VAVVEVKAAFRLFAAATTAEGDDCDDNGREKLMVPEGRAYGFIIPILAKRSSSSISRGMALEGAVDREVIDSVESWRRW